MPNYDLRAIEEVAEGSEAFVKKMIQSFISNTPDELRRMLQAATVGDFDGVKKTSHKIKPSIEMMGATRLMEINTAIAGAASKELQHDVLQLINDFNTRFEEISDELVVDYSL